VPRVLGAGLLASRYLQSVPVPAPFIALPVVLGLMSHMMNSMTLGLIFGLIFSRFAATRGMLVGAGAAYALLVFAMTWYLVLPGSRRPENGRRDELRCDRNARGHVRVEGRA